MPFVSPILPHNIGSYPGERDVCLLVFAGRRSNAIVVILIAPACIIKLRLALNSRQPICKFRGLLSESVSGIVFAAEDKAFP